MAITKTKASNKPKQVSTKKKIVLFVGPVPLKAIQKWKESEPHTWLFYNLQSTKQKKVKIEEARKVFDKVIQCSFSSDDSITRALLPFRDQIAAITSRSEAKMWYFKRTIPHVPYVKAPTESSLLWATDKIEMRKRLSAYDSTITPKFMVVRDTSEGVVNEIEKKLTYPVMVKPTGLVSSILVTNCYHRDELEAALEAVYKKAGIFHKIYKEFYHEDTPQVLVEELMDGEMYSIDGVVNGKGRVTCYPPVHVKTGKQIGFDDYFGYQRLLPSLLNEKSIHRAEDATKKAVHAIGLRYTPFHIELLKTEDGWKIIELGPRIGGYRQAMYKMSYNIDCTTNDIRTRMMKKPEVPKRVKGHTAVLNIFSRKEGRISQIKGIIKLSTISSIVSIQQTKKVGDIVKFAKNGGKSVINITMFNVDRSELLADIRRIENSLSIEV